MRVVAPLALLLAVPLLAGCLVLEEDLDGDGDKDVSVTVRHSDTASPSPSPHPAPYPLAAYGEPWHYTEDPRHPGLGLVAMVGQNGRFSFANATAGNDGEDTVWVHKSCFAPFTFKVRDATGATVTIDDPRIAWYAGACAPSQTAAFPPGDRLAQGRGWDGRMWVDRNGTWTQVPAPAGDYAWRIVFEAFDGPGREGRTVLLLDIPFRLPSQEEVDAANEPDAMRAAYWPAGGRVVGSEGITYAANLTQTIDGWTSFHYLINDGPERWVDVDCVGRFVRATVLRDGAIVDDGAPPECHGATDVRIAAGFEGHGSTVWDGMLPTGDGARVPAPPGRYEWHLAFTVVDGQDPAGPSKGHVIGFDIVIP